MVRSNPGLMLIKNGTILNKWSDEDIPDEYVLTDKLENIPLGQQKMESDVHTVGYVFLWFIIPLLLVLGVDVLVVRRRERKSVKRKRQEDALKATEVQELTDSARKPTDNAPMSVDNSNGVKP